MEACPGGALGGASWADYRGLPPTPSQIPWQTTGNPMQGRGSGKPWAQEGKGLAPRGLATLLPGKQGQAPLPWPGPAMEQGRWDARLQEPG